MYTLISILILIVCVFLSLIVLVQNSKGGGLAANFSSSNQIMGVRKTADFLEKATWTLASALVVLCLFAAFLIPSNQENVERSILDSQIENAVDPATIPSFPTTMPVTTPPVEGAETQDQP
ncbi:MAG: preprotein translocase subunit SecG [Bacteroidales bacterium]|jgi:preprotein translocase subunit SecG|nr:preprotein translocase subunit SecG [Bacteroidales bacterium]